MLGVAPAGQGTVHVVGGGIDRDYLAGFAEAHEAAGFVEWFRAAKLDNKDGKPSETAANS